MSAARRVLLALGLTPLLAAGAAQARVLLPPEGSIAVALQQARPGDTLVVPKGVHRERIRIQVPLTLRGEPGAVLDGGSEGSVLTVEASGATIEDLEIRGSGNRVITVDSGVRVLGASGVRLRRLILTQVLYGISAERSDQISIEDCRLAGRVPPREERGDGNGLHLWYCRDAVLRGNELSRFLDGIYLSFVDRAQVENNRLSDHGRYGLHTMYCHNTRLVDNDFTRNVAGIAIMFSNGLHVERNRMVRNRGPRTYGLLLRDCNGGRFEANHLVDNTVAIFMDNSNRNHVTGNRLSDNGWGVILFASCAGNEFAGNDFIDNDYPLALDMRRTDNRFDDGRRGNYWSGSAPYDLDADGVSDAPHSPVSAFAFVSKQYPDLSILARSPAVVALSVAERVFPSLQPSEAVDRFPSVRPTVASPSEAGERRGARRSWTAALAFSLLLGMGLAGFTRRREVP
ncbi:MAG TPA: nitrous oxide reductase family maturation protein NosD [Candidatus Eisenbacteria bacterium]|nr:nitrous oxide reductase family maturation protein NosD [Candidatus Eisenbacteria bacterium]